MPGPVGPVGLTGHPGMEGAPGERGPKVKLQSRFLIIGQEF